MLDTHREGEGDSITYYFSNKKTESNFPILKVGDEPVGGRAREKDLVRSRGTCSQLASAL